MSSQQRARRRRDEDSRGFDQAILTVALWFIPLSLFGYVAYQISLVSNPDLFAWVPLIDMWEMGLAAVAVLGVIALAFGWSRYVGRSREEADEAVAKASKH
ncbi:MAG: hypothetical protein H6733_09645 [Alphaproteobacteria bacterium]|nr:hypothetical protein [Alphaproteobacteria bacterium]